MGIRAKGVTAVLGALVLASLSGCGSDDSSRLVETTDKAIPAEFSDKITRDSTAPVAGLLPGDRLALTAFGGSSCPMDPIELEPVGADSLTVRFKQSGGEVCTADIAPATSIVALASREIPTARLRRVKLIFPAEQEAARAVEIPLLRAG